jgi:hypothetical protein
MHYKRYTRVVLKRQLLQNGDEATLSNYIGHIQRLQNLKLFFPRATNFTLPPTHGLTFLPLQAIKKFTSRVKSLPFHCIGFYFCVDLPIGIIIIVVVVVVV